MLYSTYIR